jgi:hypothetical protein
MRKSEWSTKSKVLGPLAMTLPEPGGLLGEKVLWGWGEEGTDGKKEVSRDNRGSGLCSLAGEQYCSKNPLGTVSGDE